MNHDTNHDVEMEARLVAEIAERLIEWKETFSESRVTRWMIEVLRLLQCNKRGLWLYLELQTGNCDRIHASYADQIEGSHVAPRATTKQAVHKAQAESLSEMHDTHPVLTSMLRDLVSHRTQPNLLTVLPRGGAGTPH